MISEFELKAKLKFYRAPDQFNVKAKSNLYLHLLFIVATVNT